MLGWLFIVVWALLLVVLGPLPLLLPYLAISLLTLLLFGLDKQRAIKQRQRIPESTLHLFSMLCGWPGAFAARQMFRHKTVKQPFTAILYLIMLIHFALFSLFQLFQHGYLSI